MIKFIVSIVALCFANQIIGQTIKYSYDASGNQSQRYIQVVNLKLATKPIEKDSTLTFNVFPNPTNDFVIINGALPIGITKADVLVYTNEGKLVKKDIYFSIEKKIQLTDLTSGIYFLTIKYGEKKLNTYKLIIQH